MVSESQRSTHWSTGSYIDLVLAAVTMQILFFCTAVWVGVSGQDFYQQNLEEIKHSMRIQLGLGWLMCVLAGIGFSILPLIYDVVRFERTLMRVYVGMNVSGQIAISVGIVSGNVSIFQSFTTIGITLLAASVVCLWSPALTILKSKSVNGKKVGPFSSALGLFLPFIGIITIACWALRNEVDGALDLSEHVLFELFFPLALVSIIISHINRRLDWKIIKSENTGKVFGVYASLLLVAIISESLHNADDISTRVAAALQLMPYLFIFIMLKPLKIISQIRNEKPHKRMVIAAIFWLPVVGITAYLEMMGCVHTSDAMMSFYRWILIFGTAFQVFWGFTAYLHDDHKKISLRARKTQWFSLLTVNLGTLITVYAMLVSWQTGELQDNITRIGIAVFALSYFSILVYWLKETFFCLYTWHKIPMFYDQYLANPEQGSGYTGQD
jgi:hypothetical protein